MTKKQDKAFSQTYGRLLAGQMMLEYLGTTGTPYAERARKLAQEIDAFITEDFLPTLPPETQTVVSPFRRKVVLRNDVQNDNGEWVTRSELECGHVLHAKSGRRYYVCQECAKG